MDIIFDNIIYNLQNIGGISVCWTELLKRVEREDSITPEYIDFSGSENNILRRDLFLNNITLRKLGKLDRYLPVKVMKDKPFIFHSSYYRNTNNKNARHIVTVHDFMYERFSQGLRKKVHSYQKIRAIDRSDVVVCISESAKADLLYYYPQFGNKDIQIIHNGVGDSFKYLDNRDELIKRFIELSNLKYILIVGNRVGCKNFKFVTEVFNKLDNSFDLVIVGHDFSEEEMEWLNFENNKRRIHLYKGISENALNALYNNAHCLLFPSLYEGFGIPILEAMRAGCPVVTTQFSSIPEVGGDAALYIDELKVDSAIEQILKLDEISLKDAIIKKGLINAGRFSWDKNFNEYLSVYSSLL